MKGQAVILKYIQHLLRQRYTGPADAAADLGLSVATASRLWSAPSMRGEDTLSAALAKLAPDVARVMSSAAGAPVGVPRTGQGPYLRALRLVLASGAIPAGRHQPAEVCALVAAHPYSSEVWGPRSGRGSASWGHRLIGELEKAGTVEGGAYSASVSPLGFVAVSCLLDEVSK